MVWANRNSLRLTLTHTQKETGENVKLPRGNPGNDLGITWNRKYEQVSLGRKAKAV